MRLVAFIAVLLVSGAVQAQKVEKPDVHIAVGGKSALYYLPLVLTERLGYFKDEGLTNFRISDFAGGTRSLEAVVGGSADVVVGRLRAHDQHAVAPAELPGVRAARAPRRRSRWRSRASSPTSTSRRRT